MIPNLVRGARSWTSRETNRVFSQCHLLRRQHPNQKSNNRTRIKEVLTRAN